jgi:hypothetical protein
MKELDELPHNLSHMPSIIKVKEWYAQSFEVRPTYSSLWRTTEPHNRSSSRSRR